MSRVCECPASHKVAAALPQRQQLADKVDSSTYVSGGTVEIASGATAFPTMLHGADGDLCRKGNVSCPVVYVPRAYGRPGSLRQPKTYRLDIDTYHLLAPEKCRELAALETDCACSTDTQQDHQVGMSVSP